MDIARIRKKVKRKKKNDVPEERSVQESGDAEEQMSAKVQADETDDISGIPEDVADEKNHAPEDADRADKEVIHASEKEDELLELLTFRLANEELAFRVAEVEEIVGLQRITKVPSVPDHVFGITSLRGKIIPIVSLKKRFGLKDDLRTVEDINMIINNNSEKNKSGKIIIITGRKGLIGAVIDNVIGVVRVPSDEMLEPPGHLNEEELKLIEGVIVFEQRFISVIHADETMNIELV
jgi:purine-binding chemotaxis protein CheW